jgi:hypothetical protein
MTLSQRVTDFGYSLDVRFHSKSDQTAAPL